MPSLENQMDETDDSGEVPAFTLPMSGERFRWCLATLDWSTGELARRLDMDVGSVRQWGRNKRVIPNVVALWLNTLAVTLLAIDEIMEREAARDDECGERAPDLHLDLEEAIMAALPLPTGWRDRASRPDHDEKRAARAADEV